MGKIEITFTFSILFALHYQVSRSQTEDDLSVVLKWNPQIGFSTSSDYNRPVRNKHREQTNLTEMLQIQNRNKHTVNTGREENRTAKWDRTAEMQTPLLTELKYREILSSAHFCFAELIS